MDISLINIYWEIDKKKETYSDFGIEILSLNGYCLFYFDITRFYNMDDDKYGIDFDIFFIRYFINKFKKGVKR